MQHGWIATVWQGVRTLNVEYAQSMPYVEVDATARRVQSHPAVFGHVMVIDRRSRRGVPAEPKSCR